MDLIARIILLLAIGSCSEASNHDPLKATFDRHYDRMKNGSGDRVGYPNRRRTQLYSSSAGHYIQVLAKGKVLAKGQDGDKYAYLEIRTVSFGKVRIKGLAMSLYVCLNKRGRITTQKQPNKWCDFLEDIRPSGYATYKSVKVEGKFLAFNRKGFGRSNAKRHDKATKFVERTRKEAIPKNVRPLKANNRYYISTDKKEPIPSWMFEYHKWLAMQNKELRNSQYLYSQNNPSLNPVPNRKKNKKHQKNNNRHSSKKSNKKIVNKKQRKTKDHSRFPPKGRLGGGTKGLE